MAFVDGMVTNMKSVTKIALKGIFKRKSFTIIILLLTFIVVVSSVTALSTILQSEDIYRADYQKASCPDIIYMYTGKSYSPDFVKFFENRDEVKNVTAQKALATTSSIMLINGKKPSYTMFKVYDPKKNDYSIDGQTSGKMLGDDEVYAPVFYKSQYNAKTGDKITIKTGNGDKKFTIKGFFDDPLFGSSLNSYKRILFSSKAYTKIQKLTLNQSTSSITFLEVNLKDAYQGTSFRKTVNQLNKAFGKDVLATLSFDKDIFAEEVTMIPKLISAFLLCFSVLLIIIVAIVIRHAILSSIEADYVSLGVLKAIGFTGKNIIASITLQYLTTGAVGAAAGIVAGFFAIPPAGKILMESSGLCSTIGMSAGFALFTAASVLVIIILIAFLSAGKAARISPVMAISYGKSPVHFSSRLNVPMNHLSFLPLFIRMAVKQMMTKIKQYASLIVVTTIFTFMVITICTITGNFSTMQKTSKMFGNPLYDINVMSASTVTKGANESEKLDNIADFIDKNYGIKSKNTQNMVSMRIDGVSTTGIAYGSLNDVKGYVLEGTVPKYDNEVAITPLMSGMIGKGVGDSVELQGGNGVKKKYLITCKIQCISEMGKCIVLSQPAYERLVPGSKPLSLSIILKDNSKLDSIISSLKNKYKSLREIGFTNNLTSFKETFDVVQSSMNMLSVMAIFLTFLFVTIITIMLCIITIYREIIDTGIFKAVGFKTMELRLQFTFRFILVSIAGGIIGAILSFLLDGKLEKSLLSSIGIANLSPTWNFSSLGIPIIFIVCLTGIVAFLLSARIKKITPNSLICE